MDSSLAQKGVSFGIAGSLQREMATEEIELVARSQSGGSAPAHMTLQKIALDGRVDLLNIFLERCTKGPRGRHEINDLDKEGFAALHYAARFNRVVITRKLLEANCNPNVLTKERLTPLHFAARHLPRSSDTATEAKGASDAKSTSRQVVQLLLQADGERLGSRPIDHGAKDSQGVTPLHMACSRGNVPAVQELLKYLQKVDPDAVNEQDNHKDTPLHEACNRGILSIVKELLDHHADVDIRNEDLETPLHTACKEGFVEIVKEILRRNHSRAKQLVEARDNTLNTPMHFAVESGNLETVKVLLLYRAGPSVANDSDIVPMHLAAGQGYTDIANVLLECDDFCKDVVDDQLQTPLHYAAQNNEVGMIKFLISKKCDKEVPDNDAASPLLLAAMWGRTEAVKALIIGGCELNVTDKDGRSAVYWAAQEGHMDVLRTLLDHEEGIQLCSVTELYHHNTPLHIAARMGKAQAVKLLVTRLAERLRHASPSGAAKIPSESSIDVNDPVARERLQTLQDEREERENLRQKVEHLDFRNDENKTPLHLAAMYGHLEVARFLVHKYPPALTDEDENGNTPLHLAALNGRTEVVNFLIQEGAEVEAKNGRLWTPLDQAADKGYADIIALLLEADAPLEAKDKSAKTPLFLACRSGHLAAAEVLMENGADVTAMDNLTKLNCLDVAVDNGHKAVALAIIRSNQWEAALRHHHEQMTPFRRMIRQMPSVAKAVLDRCMVDNVTHEDKNIMNTREYEVKFNYEFLDDYRDNTLRERLRDRLTLRANARRLNVRNHDEFSDTASTVDDVSSVEEVDKNEGFVALWGPESFSSKYHPLALMVSYSHADLLRHPVVQSLLQHKWSYYGRGTFFLNLITYLIFLLFLTMYALLLPHPDHRFCHNFSVAKSVDRLPMDGNVCPFESTFANRSDVLDIDPTVPMNNHANIALYFGAVVVILSAGMRFLVEIVQIMKTTYRYFLNVENYIELLTYASSIIFVSQFGSNCWCPTNWQWQLGAIAVFLAWINLILFLKRVPLLGIYVLMFNSILYTFLKFALIALLFVVAFCIAFYMILYKALDDAEQMVNVSPFRNAGLSFIKTMVMTTGEFEYDSIFGHNNESRNLLTSFPVVAYILWIIFLIIMPILLTNLLVGLAVDDTKAIQDQAQLKRLSLQIGLILETEEVLPAFIRRRIVRRTQVLYPNRRLDPWGKFKERIWEAERWDSVDNIRKYTQVELSPIEQVQNQTEQLSREVKSLQYELFEKNNRMEKLLILLAKKHGIQWDSEEEEEEAHLHP